MSRCGVARHAIINSPKNSSEAPEAGSGDAALLIGLLLLLVLLIHVGEAIVPECHGRLVVRFSRTRECTRAARVRRARAADLALQLIKACARVRRARAADLAPEFIKGCARVRRDRAAHLALQLITRLDRLLVRCNLREGLFQCLVPPHFMKLKQGFMANNDTPQRSKLQSRGAFKLSNG
eukprot:CAMPEP_0204196330 /NCGR_PEP_ID=MMETSP0361-20130328/63748_1 /ASSEMBLY_ACC=CAM_ASM_000343 /TAXON_ID=268821 /ORGANISM="Scrippsiella Hangoei, Strain SHTV-5" /LENGTH=179 /DNA_ID=CAMNT_0051158063 /DNA_START=381 /DNA_END=916 /DNA_ORIENTATION=-